MVRVSGKFFDGGDEVGGERGGSVDRGRLGLISKWWNLTHHSWTVTLTQTQTHIHDTNTHTYTKPNIKIYKNKWTNPFFVFTYVIDMLYIYYHE